MKQTLNRFVFKLLLFALPVLLLFEVLFRLGFAPIVTNSTLFDLKMAAIQKRHVKNIKLVAMGSSITFYELNSKLMVQNFNVPYYNFASWGLQMGDMARLLPGFVNENHPQYMIICSSFPDFISPPNDSYLNYINASHLTKNVMPELFYFKNYSSIHQIIRRKFNTSPLVPDDWGGAELTVKPQNIDSGKWNEHDIFPTKYTAGNYRALDSIAAFLKAQHIKFIFAQVPVKESYTNNETSRWLIQGHFAKCKAIVEGDGGIYLNYYNPKIFADSLFIDQYHLQNAGAIIFTNKLVADLKNIIK
jgi:hypothetical protein